MAKQLMIYDQVVPVSQQRHATLCVETGFGYEFARGLKSVPIVASEITQAAREYAVVFAPTGKDNDVAPMVVVGIRDGENFYLTDDGEWTASYIPAFLRRYPFVFTTTGDASKLALCIDESWGACNQDGRGERLFDSEGNQSEFLERLVKFNQEFQRSSQMTAVFCRELNELGLLDAKQARLMSVQGEEIRLSGFLVVDREKLKGIARRNTGASVSQRHARASLRPPDVNEQSWFPR